MAAPDTRRAAARDGVPEFRRADILCVVDAGGPPVDIDATPAKELHLFEYEGRDRPDRLICEGAGPPHSFGWRTRGQDGAPRRILSQRNFLENLPGLVGAREPDLRIILSVPGWGAALAFLREHGPAGMPRGFQILADEPVGDAPRAALEALLDGTTATLMDSDRAQRAIGAAAGSGQDLLDMPDARFADVSWAAGVITATLTCDAALPEGASVIARHGDAAVAIARPMPLDPTRRRFSVELELPRSVLFDASAPSVTLQLGAVVLGRPRLRTPLPSRRHIDAEELLETGPEAAIPPGGRKPFGILLASHGETALSVLESLDRQAALPLVELWMDGDRNHAGATEQDDLHRRAEEMGVTTLRRHRGALGADKLMLHALFHMCTTYDRFVVLDGHSFPTENAVAHFSSALDRHAENPDVLTVYGNHFGMPCETLTCPRFQSRGWGTWSDRLLPKVQELAYLYSLPEQAYLDWVGSVLTPAIEAAVDCTAPRRATDALRRFFTWDETLCLLSALHAQLHAPTAIRCVHDFGLDGAAADPAERGSYRAPPFNMILPDEVWANFHEPTRS